MAKGGEENPNHQNKNFEIMGGRAVPWAQLNFHS